MTERSADGPATPRSPARSSHLEQQLREIDRGKLSLGSIGPGGGDGGGGLDAQQTLEHNRRVDEAFDAETVRVELASVQRAIDALLG